MNVCPVCNWELLADSSCARCGFAASKIEGFLAFAPDLALGDDIFAASSYEKLFKCENNCFWFSERNKLIGWAIKKYYPAAESVLEIGCGTGYVLSGLYSTYPGKKYTGADICTSGLKFAAARVPQAKLMQIDARHIPFQNEFDVIGAFDMIEHVEEDQQVLDQLFKAVRGGGGIIVTVPQHKWLWSATDDYGGHKRRYTRGEFGDKVLKSGFEIVKMMSFMSLLLPLIAIIRWRYLLSSKGGGEKSAIKELEVNRLLNDFLRRVCRIEMRMIQKGVIDRCYSANL
jgi:SAM-dependent methyltransferase